VGLTCETGELAVVVVVTADPDSEVMADDSDPNPGVEVDEVSVLEDDAGLELEADEDEDDAGSILLEEGAETDEGVVEAAEEEDVEDDEGEAGGALPVPGSLLISTGIMINHSIIDVQFPSECKVIYIEIDVFRVLLDIPTVFIRNLEGMIA
jgi:hypothetical protein